VGLFGNKEAGELRQLLETMQLGTLHDIDAIRGGNPPPPGKYSQDTNLNARIGRAAGLVERLKDKGKTTEVDSILREWETKSVPQTVLFRAEEPTQQSFQRATEKAAVRLDSLPPDPAQGEKDQQWRKVMAEIRGRADLRMGSGG